ncbi:hypothetical protein MLD38_005178 [Melastoma candidum]|uniref:Uncharacterized protein n=1 Tax=Melastoma candidum TaxID=119954 RepID=A0ACB9S9K9_9MYRT|nr:hypothetical protein MLD38_005178 [Melastoma candidum]
MAATPPKHKKTAAGAGAASDDVANLQSDIASFASSLGLSSFNNSETAATNSHPKRPRRNPNHHQAPNKPPSLPKQKPFQSEGSFPNKPSKDMPKLPLVKSSSLSSWYADATELEGKVLAGQGRGKEARDEEGWEAVVEEKRKLGERLLWQYVREYEESRGKGGDMKMLQATQRSGTAADKVSAYSVAVGDNPLANVRALDGILGMVTSKVGKRHAVTGFEVLKELFISSLLPDRKLRELIQRPLNLLPKTKDGYSLLLFWYWEECLKQRYERFIFALEEASRDVLPVLKDKSLKIMFVLLKSKPEQERRLLSALVNKLGDPQNKGASNADYHLSCLLSEHPNMKAVVIDEVDSFLFRPHLSLRAKYHAINFLSQIRLTNKGEGQKVAKKLIDIYFAVFKVLINEAGVDKKDKSSETKKKKAPNSGEENENDASEPHLELDSRILSVLLTGVNRAFPYVSSDEIDDVVESQTPLLFKMVHSENFNVGLQALMLLDKISSKNQIVSDRFYRALYSKLLLPSAMYSSKAEMFIGLLLRAMKNDVNLKRVSAFVKRLLQVALQQPPQYACGYLFLLSELLKARPPLWHAMFQNELVDEELEHFEDVVDESDLKGSEVFKEEKGFEVNEIDDIAEGGNSSEDEDDLPDPDTEDEGSNEDDDILIKDIPQEIQEQKPSEEKTEKFTAKPEQSTLPGGYNPRHREPLYCNANRASWWELTVLASHVHPSVATMAKTLLSGANIVYNGNPLSDLSLTSFLDKFMEKKPKTTTWHGGSEIEPAKKMDTSHQLIGPEILSLAETDVPAEDLVFHKFYMNKLNSSKKPKKKKKKGAEDEGAEELFDMDDGVVEGGDESDNEEIENLLDATDMSGSEEGEYNYDDLDRIAAEDDDEDLVGDDNDEEVGIPSTVGVGDEEDDDDPEEVDTSDGDNSDIAIGDEDDGLNEDNTSDLRKGKRKSQGKTGASPFASLEDYEHLLKDNDGDGPLLKSRKKMKSSRKDRLPEDDNCTSTHPSKSSRWIKSKSCKSKRKTKK